MTLKDRILRDISKSLETIGISKIKESIIMSEKEKREYALLFCNGKHISHSELLAGTEYNVVLKDCRNKKQIGSFHTHPRNKETKNIGNLSGEDIYSTISNRRDFSCIGFIENKKPTIKCFIPAFDINPTIALKSFIAQDNYNKKLLEYNLSERKSDGTKKSLDELLNELPPDKKAILSDRYNKWIIADDELYQESKSLAPKLLSKKADLIIK